MYNYFNEWPCLKTMKIVKILVGIMLLLSITLFCLISYLNYLVNLATLEQTTKIADFVSSQIEITEEK